MAINGKELADTLLDHLCEQTNPEETCNTLLSFGYTEKDLKELRFDNETIESGKNIKG